MNHVKVGSTMEYHEEGNVGRVKVLEVKRQEYGKSPGTAVKMEALEDIGGNSAFNPIPKGTVWESWAADGAGAYAGWYLFEVRGN